MAVEQISRMLSEHLALRNRRTEEIFTQLADTISRPHGEIRSAASSEPAHLNCME